MKNLALTALIMSAALAGCAQVSATRVTDENANGLPINSVQPIIVVQDGVGKIEYIPNPAERYAASLTAFMSINNSDLAFNENGSLKSVNVKLDSTEAAKQLGKLAETITKKIPVPGTASDDGERSGSDNIFQVFGFVYNDAGEPIGLKELTDEGGMFFGAPAPQQGNAS